MFDRKKSLELALARNKFYKTNSRRLIFVNIGLIILAIALIGYYQYQSRTHITHKYFPTTPDGIFIEMPGLRENHLILRNLPYNNQGDFKYSEDLNEEVLKKELNTDTLDPQNALIQYWAKKAVISVYNLDFVNYKNRLQATRSWFTGLGHKNFLNDLNKSGNLRSVKKFKHVISIQINKIPTITNEYLYSGRRAWDVEIIFDITFDNNDDVKIEEQWLALLQIVRTNTLQSPFFGLAIHKSIFGPIKR